MLHIRNLEEGVELFKVLGSDIRVNIILLLLKEKEMNMNEIAAGLQITNGALTSHIRKLEEAGLIPCDPGQCRTWKSEGVQRFGNPNPGGDRDAGGDRRRRYFPGGNSGGAVFGLSGISHLRHFHDEKDDR